MKRLARLFRLEHVFDTAQIQRTPGVLHDPSGEVVRAEGYRDEVRLGALGDGESPGDPLTARTRVPSEPLTGCRPGDGQALEVDPRACGPEHVRDQGGVRLVWTVAGL